MWAKWDNWCIHSTNSLYIILFISRAMSPFCTLTSSHYLRSSFHTSSYHFRNFRVIINTFWGVMIKFMFKVKGFASDEHGLPAFIKFSKVRAVYSLSILNLLSLNPSLTKRCHSFLFDSNHSMNRLLIE